MHEPMSGRIFAPVGCEVPGGSKYFRLGVGGEWRTIMMADTTAHEGTLSNDSTPWHPSPDQCCEPPSQPGWPSALRQGSLRLVKPWPARPVSSLLLSNGDSSRQRRRARAKRPARPLPLPRRTQRSRRLCRGRSRNLLARLSRGCECRWDHDTRRAGVGAHARSMTFTCTANDCGHRSTHEFSKKSYQKGIVLVQCPSCKNR